MADGEIKAGSEVELRSGGPKMTVAWLEDDSAYCEWFDAKHQPQGRKFQLSSLKVVDSSAGGWGSSTVTRGS